MVCLSSLNTRVYVWSPTVRTCKLTMMMSTLIWLQIFVCLLLLMSTHTKKITELVIGHTEILLRTKCAKCSAKNNYSPYTLHHYALPDQKNDLYGNIKATADLPCLACVIILFWGGKNWKIQHFLHFLEIFYYSVCVSSAHWADCSN